MRSIVWRDLSVPLLILGLAIYVAGMVYLPPHGGLLAILAPLALWLALYALIRRPGLFLAAFLLIAIAAPLVGRFSDVPLGWLKGMVFFGAFPVWALSRVLTWRRQPWWDAARIPFLTMLLAVVFVALLAVIAMARQVPVLPILNAYKGHLLYPPLLFLALETSGDARDTRRFLWWVVALVWMVGLGAVVQSLMGFAELHSMGLSLETGAVAFAVEDPISGQKYQRVFSTLDDQIALASFAFIGIVLCLYLWGRVRSRGQRWLVALTLLLSAYTLVMTYNMTVLVGAVLFIVILAVRSRNPRLLLGLLVGLLVVGTIAYIQVGDLVRNRLIASFVVREGLGTSLQVRAHNNANALNILAGEPLLGLGLGATADTGVFQRLGLAAGGSGGLSTDNAWMNIALECGLVGLAVIVLLYTLPFWALRRLCRSASPERRAMGFIVGSAVLVLLLMNFSNGTMRTNPTNLVYWLIAGWTWRQAWEDRHAHAGPRP